MFVKKMAHFP